ncbi:hypothetical protein GLW08_04935 [Pontibacillus yanchengensis]|uniref:Uncharacterized protein n=2 Tax=Pontibacillus yanchengensis TaxID=462910 RepID=A0ACC7VEU7_9BACI|nr:hypothetical protein [Pontibacillus yanchengensis]MYL32099.1 hypothetical protein [Pontibacillus yanchengensis]MYL52679.1 hypothetical protein [Pontibacillus yanchengensis]
MTMLIAIVGCAPKQNIDMMTLLYETKYISEVDIKFEDYYYDVTELARTTKPSKMEDYIAIIEGLELKKVRKQQISELDSKMKRYRVKGESLVTNLSYQKNDTSYNIMIEISSDGFGFLVDFKDTSSSDEMYQITNATSETFSKIHTYYESIYKKVPPENDNGLDSKTDLRLDEE